MNLPFLKRFNKKVAPLYYLVLVLRDEKAEAVIFEELEGKAKIVGQKEQYFPTTIDHSSPEEFLETLDKAISEAESSLPENIQTQKTIFGVKESWTDHDQIKKEYLGKLKKASEELGLIPVGFLVISQAISHLLQKDEGAPVSAILAEINKKSVTVTLLRAGKNIETKSSEIHESIPFTVDTILKHFNVPEILPSRIIIFNGKEDLSQEFISHTWSKSLPFLHLPQITNLPEGFDAKAVLFGAATQMGFAITTSNAADEEISQRMPNPAMARQDEDQDREETEISNPNDSVDNSADYTTEDFGFVQDVDVAKIPTSQQNEVEKFQEPVEKEEIPQMGNEEKDILPKSPKRLSSNALMLIRNIFIVILGLLFALVKKINIKKTSSNMPSGKLGIIILAIPILVITLIASYFLFLKATVTILVDPKILEQNKSITFSTTEATNSSNNIIKGEFVSVSEDGSVSTAATGKKDVGTNAKGTVTIFNSLSESKTLAEGTILKSPNGLEFTLDSLVTVKAVASHSADETVAPEKATVNVTADQLGKESNLPSGTKFNVSSFDTADLIAKNDNPFSGGTKKEVTVVSKDDSAKLEKDLIKQLENKAMEDLQKQQSSNKILFPAFITKALGKKSLTAKIGDEASQVTLTGTVEYQGLSYNKDDLIVFSKSLLSKDVPLDQEINYNNIKTSVLDIEQKNDENINANLNIKALLLPKISESQLVKNLKGKSFKFTQDSLYKLPQTANVDIKLSPNLPFLPKNLPAREGNIKILIKING